MPIIKNVLKEPVQLTKERLIEVEFYLVAKALIFNNERKYPKLDSLFTRICEIIEVEPYMIEHLLGLFRKPNYAPMTTEISIFAYFNKIPVRTISKIAKFSLVSHNNNLKNYIANGEYPLVPVLKEVQHNTIKHFVNCVKEILGELGKLYD